MLAEGINCTILDHDGEMVEAACSFGFRVFYGDASRLDLLRTAGAASARGCWSWRSMASNNRRTGAP